MTDGAPPLSVVVPTRDRPALLRRCLEALRRSLGQDDQLLVVDSASRDGRVRDVALAAGADYVRWDEPGGSLARNAGWRAAHHDPIAFVDDDILVTEGWADSVRDAFGSDPDVGFVTGRVSVRAGQEGVDHPISVEDHAAGHDIADDVGRPRGISGNLAARREALERVNGFDELLGPGRRFQAGEDKDLFDRLLQAGIRGRYEPAMLAEHDQWRVRSERLRREWAYGIGAGARLAKLLRTDRPRAAVVARDVVVRWSLRGLAQALRGRYRLGVLAALLRIGGIALGWLMGMGVPVRDGHYRARRRTVRRIRR